MSTEIFDSSALDWLAREVHSEISNGREEEIRWNNIAIARLLATIGQTRIEAAKEMRERAAIQCDIEHEDPGDGPDAALTRAAAAIRSLPIEGEVK